MVHLETIWVLESRHMVVCKPMIVGSFDMMEYLVMMPSSLGDGVLCDGLEFHGKYLVQILYDIFDKVLKTLACGALGLEPTHLLPCRR